MKAIYSNLLPLLLAISFIAPSLYAGTFPPAVPAVDVPAVMNYVSTDMYTQSDAYRTGSVLGGVSLYLRGAGLPNDISTVSVTIDGQDCPLDLGLSSCVQIACTVPAAKQEGKVTIQVAVGTTFATCSTSLCYYVYTASYTPVFQFVVPSAVNPNSPLKVGGIPRVAKTSLQDVILNNILHCNFDYYGDQALTADALSFGKCQIDAVQAGFYKADMTNLVQGQAIKVASATVVPDKSYNPYEIVVVPVITKLSSNSGPSGGEDIIITGNGFSSTAKNNEVLFDGKPALVMSASLTSIKVVLLQPAMPVAGPRAGHAGVIQRSFGNKNTLADLKKDSSFINGGGTITRLMSFEIPYNDRADDFSQALEALFYAPVTGDYQFLLSASRPAELSITQTPLSKTGLQKIAEITTGTGLRDFFDPGEKSQISSPVSLEAGQYYYMQAIHLASGTEHLSVGVRIPNSKKSAFNPREVIKVQIKAQTVRLETIFTMKKTSENFVLKWAVGSTIKSSSAFSYPASASTVQAALSQIGIEAVVLEQNYLNFDGQKVSSAQAIQVQYKVKFYTSPTISPLPGLSNPSNGGFIKSSDVTPTPLVSGSYSLSVGTSSVTLAYNAEAVDIEKAFNTAVGEYFATRVYRYGRCEDGCQYVVYFTGSRNDVPAVTVANNGLTGGSGTVDIAITLLQDANSDDTLFTPIPTDLLRTLETTAQITVRTNGVLAACTGNCKYQPVTVSSCTILTGFTLYGAILEMEFSNAADKTLSSFTDITFGGSKLTAILFDKTTQKLNASIPLNPNGTPHIVAGAHLPRLKVAGCGYIQVAKEVQPLTIYETIDTLDAIEINEGFLRFTAEGTGYGFGLGSGLSYGTTVNIGGVDCELVSLTNNEIVCDAFMEVTDGPFTVTVNGLTVDTPFHFDKPDITIDLTGDCYIDLIGEGFSDKTVVKLKNSETPPYLEKCRSCVRNSTLIRCATCGLPPGDYTAVMTTVLSKTQSWQASQPFKIVFDVNSVTPSQGSLYGGTVLTLKGHGFSETLNKNQISIGSETGANNIRCTVIEASRTELKCVVAPNNGGLQGPQAVWAIIGLEFDATCDGDCSFTFTQDATPQITEVDKLAIKADDLVTFKGNLFSSTTEFSFNGLLAEIVQVTSTEITVRVPKILAMPLVPFSVYDPAYGYYDNQNALKFTSDLTFTDYTPKTGSRYGTYIKLTGTGFSSSAKVLIGTSTCTIVEVTPTQITCKTPTLSNGATGAVTITQDTYKSVACAGCAAFKASDTYSPTISKIEQSTTAEVYTVKITGTKLVIASPVSPVSITLTSAAIKQSLTITTNTATSIIATLANPIPGTYTLDIRVGDFAPSVTASYLAAPIAFPQSTPPAAITTSRAGGDDLTLTFDGVTLPQDRSLMSVTLAGFPCPISYVGTNYLVCTTPPLIVPAYSKLGQEAVLTGPLQAMSANDKVNNAFDGSIATSVTGTSTNCYLGVDVGEGLVAELSQVQYYPKVGLEAAKLALSVIEGSSDGITYQNIYTVTGNIYEGYNLINFAEGSRPRYRFYRWRQDQASSKCELAELVFKGIKMSDIDTATPEDVLIPKATVTINQLTSKTVDANVEYRKDNTPVISGVTPNIGTSAGGTLVTFEGKNFGNSVNKVQVFIDGTECVVQSVQSDEVTCITGALPDVSERTERLHGVIILNVRNKGSAKVDPGVSFLYAERWSDWRTWGCDGLPIDGDSVHIPIGMNLLVDIRVPELVAVVVEGGLIFEDMENEFNCKYLIVRNGLLRIGTEEEPYQSNLVITVRGVREDEQLPIFGNKAIAVYEGTVEIHGTPRAVLDTKLSATVKQGAVDITVDDATSFEAGDEIAISSTSNNPSQNEKRTIICKVGNVLTLDYALDFDHLSEIETITINGAQTTVEIKAIVALLTRNVVIQGDEEYSEDEKYGVHMMFYDPGTRKTQIKMSYAEVRFAGHAGYADRHPINFQNMGNMMGSYVIGCSVHDTYYRGIQVKGTSYITVSKNVLYNTENEAIALPDGSERMNTIEDNVIIQVVSSLYRFNSYRDPGAMKISNPLNFVRRNKVGGAISNGYTLVYSSYAAGASPTKTICPQGEQLGAFEDNSVLSAGSVGMFIDSYYPRTYACRSYKDATKQDPFSPNMPITATYSGFTAARTIIGFRAWRLGAVVLKDFKLVDSSTGGMEVRKAQYAPLNSTQVINGLIVGNVNIPQGKLALKSYWGILVPSSDGFTVNGMSFAHFDSTASSLTGCSNCANAWEDTASRVTFTSALKFTDVAKRVDHTAPYTHIFKDTDGSLTGLSGGGTAVYNLPHLRVPQCSANTALTGLACDKTVEVRGVNFWNMNPTYMREKTMGVLRLVNGEDPFVAPKSSVTFTSYRYSKYGYSAPFVLGYPYQISFDVSLDFDSLLLETSPFAGPGDAPTTIVFNYTEPREDYDVLRKVYLQTKDTNISNTTVSYSIFDNSQIASKNFGDFYNDVYSNDMLFSLTGNGLGAPIRDAPDVTKAQINAYRCRYNCPAPVDTSIPTNCRTWSTASGWPGGAKPVTGGDVIIPSTDLVTLDEDTPILNTIEINGYLQFGDNLPSITLRAKKIWVRGKLIAGTEDDRYQNVAVIELVGNRNDTPIVVNYAVDAGTKVIAVTGELSLFGQDVKPIARLAENAAPGAKQIKVTGDVTGWKANYNILVAASMENPAETEQVTIKTISTSGDITTITFDTALQYFHYGELTPYSASVDMRTEVLLMTRNVQVRGTTEDGLGARILVTDEYGDFTKTGIVRMGSASLDYGGQGSTDRAGLTFEYATNGKAKSTITRCVFSNSRGYGVRFQSAKLADLKENIIYNSNQYGIKFHGSNSDIGIYDNIVIGVNSGPRQPIMDMGSYSAGIAMFDETNTKITIQRNIVIGATFGSYLISSPACTGIGANCGQTSFFMKNVAHSGKFGYIAYGDLKSCIAVSDFTAYRMTYGIISYYRINEIQACNLFLSDNVYSLNLASSSDGNRKFTVTDSTFVGLAFPNCADCYKTKDTQCNGKAALALNAFTNDTRPDKFQFYRSSRDLVLGSSYNLERVNFENFQDNLVSGCSGNKIFSWSEHATDFVPYLSISAATLKNCQNRDPLAWFRDPVNDDHNSGPEEQCTLVKNAVVRDNDGSFMTSSDKKGTLFPKNPAVANDEATFNANINGYEKDGLKYALLGFKSLDTDKSLISLSPIEITSDDGFFSKINSHRNNNPRESGDTQKWISIIKPGQTYDLAFPRDIPIKLQFELQGDKTDFAIISIKYNSNKVVAITNQITGTPVEPSIARPGDAAALNQDHPCGTYIFDRENAVITFKITAEDTCRLVVEQTNSLVANIRFDITVDEFFDQGGVAPFIDKVAAILNIPSRRIRIVSVYKGSVGIVFAVDADIQGENSMDTSKEQLDTYSTGLQSAMEAGQLNVYQNATILSYTHQTIYAEAREVPTTESATATTAFSGSHLTIIVVAAACGVAVIAVAVGFYMCKRNRGKKSRSVVKIVPETMTRTESALPELQNPPADKRKDFAVAESRKNLAANMGSIDSFGTFDDATKRDTTPSNKLGRHTPLPSIPELPKRKMSIEEKIEDLS